MQRHQHKRQKANFLLHLSSKQNLIFIQIKIKGFWCTYTITKCVCVCVCVCMCVCVSMSMCECMSNDRLQEVYPSNRHDSYENSLGVTSRESAAAQSNKRTVWIASFHQSKPICSLRQWVPKIKFCPSHEHKHMNSFQLMLTYNWAAGKYWSVLKVS